MVAIFISMIIVYIIWITLQNFFNFVLETGLSLILITL